MFSLLLKIHKLARSPKPHSFRVCIYYVCLVGSLWQRINDYLMVIDCLSCIFVSDEAFFFIIFQSNLDSTKQFLDFLAFYTSRKNVQTLCFKLSCAFFYESIIYKISPAKFHCTMSFLV